MIHNTPPPLPIGKLGKAGIINARSSPLKFRPALWLDAADTATITKTGSAVSQWNDKSGNGFHATQGTSTNQPKSDISRLNGLNAITFSTDDFFVLPSGVYSIPAGDSTVFSVFKSSTTALAYQIVIAIGTGTSNNMALFYRDDAASVSFRSNTSGTNTSAAGVTFTDINVLAGRRSGTAQDVFVNLNSGVTAASAANVTGCDGARIGMSMASTFPLTGDLGEILLFSRALSDADIKRVITYLRNKWAIPRTSQFNLVDEYSASLFDDYATRFYET